MLSPQRAMRHLAWRARLGSRFAEVDEVFDDAVDLALALIGEDGLPVWIDWCADLGRLGRGPEPLLAGLAVWPEVAQRLGPDALAPLQQAVAGLQRSPQARAIAPLLRGLPALLPHLPDVPALARYLALVQDLARRTSVSIHGRHATHADPGLGAFLAAAPGLLAQVPLDGLVRWADAGLRAHAGHPQRLEAYLAAESEDSRAILLRERPGTLLADVSRQLACTLRALWGLDAQLVPMPVRPSAEAPWPHLVNDGSAEAPLWGLRLPELLEPLGPVAALPRYRLMATHLAAHQAWSQPLWADNWSPRQRLAVECLEDARIDTLLLRRCPGLAPLMRQLHPLPSLQAVDTGRQSGLRVRLARLSHALLFDAPTDAPEREACAGLQAALARGPSSTAEVARLGLAWAAHSRAPGDQLPTVVFAGTRVDWRDDNRSLWRFIEAGDEEDSFSTPPSASPPADAGLPPRLHPEWDEAAQRLRPDWVSVHDGLQPAGDAAEIDALLRRHAGTARHLRRLMQVLRPQDRTRLRRQEEGTELDLDAALRSLVDARASRQAPDTRVQMRTRPDGRRLAVTLLLDLSASVNDPVPGAGGETVLSLSRAATALLAQAVDGLGDQLAIAGFQSDTRHALHYWHIQGFAERWRDGASAARLAGTRGAGSTRLGGALRHAGAMLLARPAEQRLLLVLTDGQPSDIDVPDPAYLVADAAQAVRTLAAQGLPTHCVSLDARADDYVRRIFGKRFYVVDRVDQLPRGLPKILASLTL